MIKIASLCIFFVCFFFVVVDGSAYSLPGEVLYTSISKNSAQFRELKPWSSRLTAGEAVNEGGSGLIREASCLAWHGQCHVYIRSVGGSDSNRATAGSLKSPLMLVVMYPILNGLQWTDSAPGLGSC